MLKFYVDFNSCEGVDTAVVVRLDTELNAGISEDQMEVGSRVLLYEETMECEAILRLGSYYKWVADLLVETIRHLPEDQWYRFEKTENPPK
jgi:hypothetical protein